MKQHEQLEGNLKLDKVSFDEGGQVQDGARNKWLADLSAGANTGFKGEGKLIKVQANVPDEPEEEQDAHAEEAQPKNMIDALRMEDPKNLGKGMQNMQGLAEQFANSPDKAKALKDLREGFEDSVKQSDKDFEGAKQNFEAARLKLKPQMEPKLANMEKTGKAFGAEMAKLPEPEQQRMQWMLSGYKSGQNSKEFDGAIAKEVGKHKGLMPAFEAAQKAQNELAPFMKQAEELKASMEGPAIERLASRRVYSEVLMQGGDPARAKRMEMEGRAITMGIPLEKVDELEKRLQQKQN